MWKLALNNFIKPYIEDKEVEAILLVGSYAVGNQNEYSDIDVYIVLNDNANYRKRGNKLVNNYLIEYFINPIHKVKEYLLEDKRAHGGSMANMLLNGKVLLDRHGIIEKLKEEALKAKEIQPEKDIMKYYACWHAYDEYEAAMYHSEIQYYLCLKYLVDCYLFNNGYAMLPEQKIERFFKDKEYREKYNIGKFPNNNFNKLVINCFDEPCKKNLKILYDFVIEDGKFDINNFELKDEIEKRKED